MSDIDIYGDSDSDDNSVYDLDSHNGAGGVVHSTTLFSQRARRRNILTERLRVTVTLATERNACFVSYSEDIILQILQETNHKAHDLRRERERGLIANSVTKNRTYRHLSTHLHTFTH